MGWTFLYLMVFLKLPIVALLSIVWWAIRAEPEPATEVPRDGGSRRPRHPRPARPRTPRRGPHGGDAVVAPRRSRTTALRVRSSEQR